MDRVLEGFFGDIVIKGSDLEKIQHTKYVLNYLKLNNLYVNKGKSKFYEISVKYYYILDIVVNSDGLHKIIK